MSTTIENPCAVKRWAYLDNGQRAAYAERSDLPHPLCLRCGESTEGRGYQLHSRGYVCGYCCGLPLGNDFPKRGEVEVSVDGADPVRVFLGAKCKELVDGVVNREGWEIIHMAFKSSCLAVIECEDGDSGLHLIEVRA